MIFLIIKGGRISREGYTADTKETRLGSKIDLWPEGYKRVKNVKEGSRGSFMFSEGHREYG